MGSETGPVSSPKVGVARLKRPASGAGVRLAELIGLPARRLGTKLIVALALLIAGYFLAGPTFGVFAALFFIFIALKTKYVVPLSAAFLSLAVCAIFLMLGQSRFAEQTGVWAFYFLAISLALMLPYVFKGSGGDARTGDIPGETGERNSFEGL
jgi:hypothetical protein